jgi:hypothetical protein
LKLQRDAVGRKRTDGPNVLKGERHLHGFGSAEPVTGDVTLWRYMPFVKFVAMIEGRSLHMTRGDKFGDEYEGSLALANAEQRARNLAAGPNPEMASFSHFELARKYIEVSCWHQSERENSVMWAGYGGSDAVAIKTTSNLLSRLTTRALTNDPHVHRFGLYPVKYFDFDTGIMDLNASPFMYKRLHFEAEREVRLMRESWTPMVTVRQGESPQVAPHPPSFPESGSDIRISSELYLDIVLSPNAEDWQTSLLERLALRFQITAPVRRSELAVGTPRF